MRKSGKEPSRVDLASHFSSALENKAASQEAEVKPEVRHHVQAQAGRGLTRAGSVACMPPEFSSAHVCTCPHMCG